jgi:hypothetical protein
MLRSDHCSRDARRSTLEILVKREAGLVGQGRGDGFGAEVPLGPPHPCEPAMQRRP